MITTMDSKEILTVENLLTVSRKSHHPIETFEVKVEEWTEKKKWVEFMKL